MYMLGTALFAIGLTLTVMCIIVAIVTAYELGSKWLFLLLVLVATIPMIVVGAKIVNNPINELTDLKDTELHARAKLAEFYVLHPELKDEGVDE